MECKLFCESGDEIWVFVVNYFVVSCDVVKINIVFVEFFLFDYLILSDFDKFVVKFYGVVMVECVVFY